MLFRSGFEVELLTLESLPGTTCGDIMSALASWYLAGDPWDDHYALLIGDVDVLPQCPTPLAGGVLSDISYAGALIEGTTMQPGVGMRIVLYVELKTPRAVGATRPFGLTGHVARHHSTGFAIEYEDNHDPDLRRMVDDAAAIVATRR